MYVWLSNWYYSFFLLPSGGGFFKEIQDGYYFSVKVVERACRLVSLFFYIWDMSEINKEQEKQLEEITTKVSKILISGIKEKVSLILDASEANMNVRKEQGFNMTYKKRQMYEIGFEDGIKWIIGDNLYS